MQEISTQATQREKPALWPFLMAVLVMAHLFVPMLRLYDAPLADWIYGHGLSVVTVLFAVLPVTRREVRRLPAAWVLWAYALWMLAAQALVGGIASVTGDNKSAGLIMLAFVAFPLGLMLPAKYRDRTLQAMVDLFLLVMLGLCVAGLTVALTHGAYGSPNGYLIGMSEVEKRLYLSAHPNTLGMLCMVSIVLSLYSLLRTRCVVRKILYGVALLAFTLTLVLTDSRSSLWAAALCVGAAGFLLARSALRGRGMLLSWGAGLLVWVAIGGACLGLFRFEMDMLGPYVAPPPQSAETLIERIRNDKSGLELVKDIGARVEGEAEGGGKGKSSPGAVTARSLTSDTLNGRTGIWKTAFEAIGRNPSILLHGADNRYIQETLYPVNPDSYPEDVHNGLIGVLLRGGLPALLLAVAFLVLLLLPSLRLFLDASARTTLAQRYLPVTLLGLFVVSLVETLLFGIGFTFYDAIFYAVAGFVVAIAPPRRAA